MRFKGRKIKNRQFLNVRRDIDNFFCKFLRCILKIYFPENVFVDKICVNAGYKVAKYWTDKTLISRRKKTNS